ncbi:unnamed protein product [Brassica napus]|uniref:(rape) hypothetical protein n=1 Tax=Brassica napus TaxID=3708 RepID=A0A816P004_BRANA|nr:unnamed protein product [Brassica napus]
MANNKAKSIVFQKKNLYIQKVEVFSRQMLRFGNYSKDSQQWRPFLLTKNYHSSPSFKTTSSSEPSFIHLPEKRSRVATKASLARTNEASLSASSVNGKD